jgi:hypothetical protein
VCFARVAHDLLAPDGPVAAWVHHDVVAPDLDVLPEQGARRAAAVLGSELASREIEKTMLGRLAEFTAPAGTRRSAVLVACASSTGEWLRAAVAPGGWPVTVGTVRRTFRPGGDPGIRPGLAAAGFAPVVELSRQGRGGRVRAGR